MLKFIIGGFSAWCSICGSCAKWRVPEKPACDGTCVGQLYAPDVSRGYLPCMVLAL